MATWTARATESPVFRAPSSKDTFLNPPRRLLARWWWLCNFCSGFRTPLKHSFCFKHLHINRYPARGKALLSPSLSRSQLSVQQDNKIRRNYECSRKRKPSASKKVVPLSNLPLKGWRVGGGTHRKSKTREGGGEPSASPAWQKPSIMSVWCSVCLALSSRDICCLLSPASWPGQGRRTAWKQY